MFALRWIGPHFGHSTKTRTSLNAALVGSTTGVGAKCNNLPLYLHLVVKPER